MCHCDDSVWCLCIIIQDLCMIIQDLCMIIHFTRDVPWHEDLFLAHSRDGRVLGAMHNYTRFMHNYTFLRCWLVGV